MQNTEEEPIELETIQTATAAHTRYFSSSPAATLHEKIQGFVLRLPPHNIAHATFMQPFQCDLPPQCQETHRITHTGTTTRCKTHRRNRLNSKRSKPQPPHTRGTFHRRLQPLYTEKRKVWCSGFLPTTHGMQHSCSHSNAICTPLRHHSPSSPLPFFTTSLRHHFPSPPLPFLTTSLRHHFPSSSLPFFTTSLLHHFPSSPLPFLTTSLLHHFPSSPLPFLTTSLLHHFPSSPLPFFTTSLRHHFPSSPLPFIITSLRHHSPSSSLPLILLLCTLMWSTTLHQGQLHCFLFFCYVWLHYVLLCDLPPFIKVNCIASYSFVMYCYVIYHPSSRSTALLLILLLCMVTLCIVMWSTTLHQGQLHSFLFFCYVLLDDIPPFIISSLRILFVRNSEVLLPNFLW